MRKNHLGTIALTFLVLTACFCATPQARAQTVKASYPEMAPLDQYLMLEKDEIALALSAAPASISSAAEVMVLGRNGYTTAVKGTNGFVCIIERGWANATDEPDFWNPKLRGPICFNPPAAKTFLPVYLMKTKLILAGKTKVEMVKATEAAFDKKELPALAPGSMCYMLAKDQYLGDSAKHWHPHLMFFIAGDAVKSWGANLTGSPVMAANDPEERATIFLVTADTWSDGTPGPPMTMQ